LVPEAIESTERQTTPEIWAGVDQDVIARHDDTQLATHVGVWEPWTSWARTQPRIRRILDEHTTHRPNPARPPARDGNTEVSAAALARRAIEETGPGRRMVLRELGRRADLIVLDLAEDTRLRNTAGWTPGIAQALHHLGTAALIRARTWAGSTDGTLRDLAAGVLSEFGDRDDGPYLLAVLAEAADAGAWCATEAPARGLGRLRITEATDALVHLWETTPHSLARDAVFEGLRGCAPDTADAYAVEALDDCEPSVQQAVCNAAPDTASARLTQLRDDPLAAEIGGTTTPRAPHQFRNRRMTSPKLTIDELETTVRSLTGRQITTLGLARSAHQCPDRQVVRGGRIRVFLRRRFDHGVHARPRRPGHCFRHRDRETAVVAASERQGQPQGDRRMARHGVWHDR
jgi:hypothetical protein